MVNPTQEMVNFKYLKDLDGPTNVSYLVQLFSIHVTCLPSKLKVQVSLGPTWEYRTWLSFGLVDQVKVWILASKC